jgi:hypothetical protein
MIFSDDLFLSPDNVQTRWSTPENSSAAAGAGGEAKGGRKGRPCVTLKGGESIVIASAEQCSGIVRRIWVTIDHRSGRMLRGLKIECFWDGATVASVAAPFGDFFGTGLGRLAPFQSAYFSNPEGRSFNCQAPMPFRRGMRIVLTNETPVDLNALYYEVNFTVGDKLPANALYFHAHWRRENPTTLRRDYEIVPKIAGRGRFLGCNIGVVADKKLYHTTWWGEGEVKLYLDGDKALPTLCGTGTEDYIGTAWGQGRYDHLYQGCHVADAEKMQYCFYRYHGPDPVFFYCDLRVTIHQIGCWDPSTRWQLAQKSPILREADAEGTPVDFRKDDRPYVLFERQDDWSSCAYFYLDRVENGLPGLAGIEDRMAGVES